MFVLTIINKEYQIIYYNDKWVGWQEDNQGNHKQDRTEKYTLQHLIKNKDFTIFLLSWTVIGRQLEAIST